MSGIINRVYVTLYDASTCPIPDSKGRIDFSSCGSHLISGEYSSSDQILKHIDHPGATT